MKVIRKLSSWTGQFNNFGLFPFHNFQLLFCRIKKIFLLAAKKDCTSIPWLKLLAVSLSLSLRPCHGFWGSEVHWEMPTGTKQSGVFRFGSESFCSSYLFYTGGVLVLSFWEERAFSLKILFRSWKPLHRWRKFEFLKRALFHLAMFRHAKRSITKSRIKVVSHKSHAFKVVKSSFYLLFTRILEREHSPG